METNDIDLDDIGALFMKNSSPNVTLGMYRFFREIDFTKNFVKSISRNLKNGKKRIYMQAFFGMGD